MRSGLFESAPRIITASRSDLCHNVSFIRLRSPPGLRTNLGLLTTQTRHFPIGALVRDLRRTENGPGRILNCSEGIVTVRFEWSGAIHQLRLLNTLLARYRLLDGVPVHFAGGSRLHNSKPKSYLVRGRIESEDTSDLWTYKLDVEGKEVLAPETELVPLGMLGDDLVEWIEALAWRGPKRFFARWAIQQVVSRWYEDTEGIPALVGARIRPLGHQLYAVRRVLWDRVPRFVLADEVGLGKTIEAGLIVQSFLAENPEFSVLIIAPGSMSRQWQCEMYLRFGGRAYGHLDSSMFRDRREFAESTLEQRRLIVSTTALEQNRSLQDLLSAKHWGMVIIDEAHQFSPKSSLYRFLHQLAKNSYGLLALSATPSKREIDSLTGLLSLVAPRAYAPEDYEGLARKLEQQRDVWDRLNATSKFIAAANREKGGLDEEEMSYIAGEWEGVVVGDPVVDQFLKQLKSGDEEAADELVSYIQEFHRIDHRIIRTRRATVSSSTPSAARSLSIVGYSACISEIQLCNHLREIPVVGVDDTQLALRGLYARITNTSPEMLLMFLNARQQVLRKVPKVCNTELIRLLIADPGPAEELALIEDIVRSARPMNGELKWLETAINLATEWHHDENDSGYDGCGRFRTASDWIKTHLAKDRRNKILVFSQEAHLVSEFVNFLRMVLNKGDVEQFHHLMNEGELSSAALKFQHGSNCRVLVCDELGGEGRNFQTATAVLHLDIPWSVARIEQRIGRLDRVGRNAQMPVESVVIQGPEATERALLDLHLDVFDVFRRSLGGIEFVLPELQRQISLAACHGAEKLSEIKDRLKERVVLERNSADEAFELALDASKHQLSEANELAGILQQANDGTNEQLSFIRWAKLLGISTRERRGFSWDIEWKQESLVRPLAEFLPDYDHEVADRPYFFAGTFNRETALTNESLQFFAPGHRLVDALTNDVQDSNEGRVTIFRRDLGVSGRGRVFLLVLARCLFNGEMLKDPNLGLLCRIRKYQWPEIEGAVLELFIERDAFGLVTDPVLQRRVSKSELEPSDRKVYIEELPRLFDVLRLAALVRSALTEATNQIRYKRKGLLKQASQRLSADLRQELGYFRWLKSTLNENARESVQEEIDVRQRAVESLQEERITVDAIALLLGA